MGAGRLMFLFGQGKSAELSWEKVEELDTQYKTVMADKQRKFEEEQERCR